MNQLPPTARRGILGQLYVQVLAAVALGVIIGYFAPAYGIALKPLSDGFIQLVRVLLAPVIFCTIVTGIARMESLKAAGRIGLKALIYFEVVSTFALVIGLVVVNVLQPGAGMNVDAKKLNGQSLAAFAPHTPTTAGVAATLAHNPMLQVIVAALIIGLTFSIFRAESRPLLRLLEMASQGLFFAVRLVMRFAPLGALGGVAFTVGQYGLGSLGPLARLMLALYLTCALFVFGVLGLIARRCGVSLWKFLRYIKEEILVVFATVSTEAVLPQFMEKMESLGCAKTVVGLVLPAGYTFNPDGTAIYLTMASVFIAQATNTPLTLGDQLFVLAVLLLTSKGSAGVAGAGFIALAATLSTLHQIPATGLVLLLGVDRFMNEARAVTNLIGNGVATIAVATWENSFDRRRATEILSSPRGLPDGG